MKNKIIFLAIIALAFSGLQSCDKDTTAGLTRTTYYPLLTVLGGEIVDVNKGETYTDPGVYAELNGEDISGKVEVVSSNVNTAEVGIYTVSYKVTNEDGFSATASRTVVVGDPSITADISGAYAADANSYREVLATGATVTFNNSFNIEITRVASGVFYVSDLFGGWYDQRAGYGAAYAMTGYILLHADNTFELLSSHINGWGDALDDLENGAYDPNTGALHWDATYAQAYTWFIDFAKK